jgi:hypothetical protein
MTSTLPEIGVPEPRQGQRGDAQDVGSFSGCSAELQPTREEQDQNDQKNESTSSIKHDVSSLLFRQ